MKPITNAERALAGFGMYALVYAGTRYVAPFVHIFWVGLLARGALAGRRGLAARPRPSVAP